MKKKIIALCLCLCLAAVGCGNSDLVRTGKKAVENQVYANDYISLAPYTGLKAEKAKYTVSQENIDQAIKEELEEYASYQSVDRTAQKSDLVYFDYTASIKGKTVSQSQGEDNYISLGDAEFGEDFDKKIIGQTKGSHLDFSISYSDDYTNEISWAGQTVYFSISIIDVQKEVLPKTNSKFLQKHFNCKTYKELEKKTEKSLEKEYEAESIDNLKDDLLLQVVHTSAILSYKKADYESAYETAVSEYQEYAELFGTDLEEIYEMLDVTDKELEDSAQEILGRNLVSDAIIEKEGLSLTDKEYHKGLEYYAGQNGYDSGKALLKDFPEEEVREQITRDKVLDLLVEKAEITEVPTEYTE